jgi:hypothetical protein
MFEHSSTFHLFADMRIVPVGSSGKILESVWFLKMMRKIGLSGDTFYHEFSLLIAPMRQDHGGSLKLRQHTGGNIM